jgi:hypothetical protein
MSGLRHGVVLLLLAVPFGLYAAWHVQSVSRADLIVSDPPSDKGLPGKEQLAATRAKTEKWSGDLRKAARVTYQFRAPEADDVASDPDCKALAESAAKRAADLTDLETFLSDKDKPVYTGRLRVKYLEWHSIRASLSKAGQKVEEWFTTPLPVIDSSEAAAKAMADFNQLVAEYTKETQFSDPARAAGWKVRARVEVTRALEAAAEAPYARALDLPLPLPAGEKNADVRRAVGAPRAIREQVKLIQAELTRAEIDKLTLPERVLADAKAAAKRADEWAARERLLGLFAEPKLFENAAGAAEWLTKVNAQFERTNSPEDRALLRRKVQEFCEAFVPPSVLLDSDVMLKDKRVPRGQVTVKYYDAKAGKTATASLTADPDPKALSEFTVARLHPGNNTFVIHNMLDYTADALAPTEVSRAAVVFHEARRQMAPGPDTPKWSAKSIDELKNKCKPLEAAVNKLVVREGKTETSPRLMDRLESLSKGAAACPQLFAKGP